MKKKIPAAAVSLALCASLALPASALNVEQARTLLDDYYISSIPAVAQQAQTLDELFAALGDPYTTYYTAEEYAAFLEGVNGEILVGIGVSVHNAFDKGFHIMSTLPNSPAAEAGLKAGDVMIAIDGAALTAQDNITTLLSGEEGSPVTVTVRRANGAVADFTMLRRQVQVPIVTYEKRGDMGYIDCATFGASTADDVSFPLASMDKHTAVWVMDLRSTPGGSADSAAVTAAQFVGGGPMVFYRDGQDAYSVTSISPKVKDLTNKPLIILTSPSSASAAELFSGIIRDKGAGISIGERTFGKGIAQVVLDEKSHPELFQGDAIRITAYQFFSPRGNTCHISGILPTLMMEAQYTEAVAALLSSPAPVRAQGWMKLEVDGQTFYLDPQSCHDDPDSLTHLLEALPPAAKLYLGRDTKQWKEITPTQGAEKFGLTLKSRTFSDLENCEYQASIDVLSTYGLLSGDGYGNFMPDKQLTRAELAAMLTAAFNLPEGDAPAYPDVPPDAWYAGSVSAMTTRGFLAGTDKGTFEPDAPLTNQELYAVLSSIAVWTNMDAHSLAQKGLSAPQWLEYHAYPEWAQPYARNLGELGLDVDHENPTAHVTRGQAAHLLYQLMDSLGLFWF